MHKLFYSFCIWAFALLLALPGHAQYATTPPAQNGAITSAEYNNNTFQAISGGTWLMTWDATNLYVGKIGSTNFDPIIMYLDLDPTLPVTGGGVAQGNLTGNTDYSVTPVLPFRADVRVFAVGGPTNTYIEVRRRDGQGNWGPAVQTDLKFVVNGNNREMSLSWNTLTGGGSIPPSFNWLGYVMTNVNQDASNNNTRYDQVPANPKADAIMGRGAPLMEYYYTVASTANGSATNPFSLKSYTFLGSYNSASTSVPTDDNFGDISVWDFTMNLPNGRISRTSSGTSNKNWTISGSLVVGDGIVYFGSPAGGSFGNTFVGNVRMVGNGILNMDQTNQPLTVREDVTLVGGSQLVLSGVQGGDLNVGRNFLVTNGVTSPATFQTNTRAVTFTGNNATHTISANNGYVVPFTYLFVSSPSGTVTLNTNIAIGNLLTFSDGLLYTGSYFVQLDGAARLNTETAASHIIGNVRITQYLGAGGSGTKEFGNIGLLFTPQPASTARGSLTVTRVTGTTIPGVGKGTNGNSIQRYFVLTSGDPSVTGLDLLLQFGYRTDELNGITEDKLALYQSTSGAPGTYTALTTPPSANASTHTISYNYRMELLNGTYLTLSDNVTPLPVTLVAFTAKATALGTAILNWNTASEKNSKGFGIERQLDANGPWQSVGYVAAANLLNGSAYQFVDQSLAVATASPKAYYRLRQEDLNGTTSYSPVAVVARPVAAGSTELVLSPVPATDANLSVAFAEVGQAGLEVAVLNTQGQRMLHFTTEASTDAALSLPVQSLAAGMYIVQVQAPGQPLRYARFVKP